MQIIKANTTSISREALLLARSSFRAVCKCHRVITEHSRHLIHATSPTLRHLFFHIVETKHHFQHKVVETLSSSMQSESATTIFVVLQAYIKLKVQQISRQSHASRRMHDPQQLSLTHDMIRARRTARRIGIIRSRTIGLTAIGLAQVRADEADNAILAGRPTGSAWVISETCRRIGAKGSGASPEAHRNDLWQGYVRGCRPLVMIDSRYPPRKPP